MGGGILVFGHLMNLNEGYNVQYSNRCCDKRSQRFKRTYERINRLKWIPPIPGIPSSGGLETLPGGGPEMETWNHRNYYVVHGWILSGSEHSDSTLTRRSKEQCICGHMGLPCQYLELEYVFGTSKDRCTCGHPRLPCQYMELQYVGPTSTGAPVGIQDSHASI